MKTTIWFQVNYSTLDSFCDPIILQDGKHNTSAVLEIKVADVQNIPPVFDSSFVGVVQENAEIGTLVLTVHARDGDTGNPRGIVYKLVTSKRRRNRDSTKAKSNNLKINFST